MDSIPRNVADLTVEYLNSVLNGFKTITEVELKVPKTHGGMSIVRKLFLVYDMTTEGLSPSTIISKQSSQASDNHLNKSASTDIMRHGKLYEREILLNKYFEGRMFIPTIYYSKMDEMQNFVLLMEDCSSDSEVNAGAENIVQTCLTFEQVMLIIRDLALLHSEFYHDNSPDRLRDTKGILKGNQDTFMMEKGLQFIPEFFQFMYYTVNHDQFSSCDDKNNFGAYNGKTLLEIAHGTAMNWNECCEYLLGYDYEQFTKFDIPSKIKAIQDDPCSVEEQFFTAFKLLTEESPLTLVHGDFRADNILIRDNNMKLIDWQCTSLGSGLIDVMSLLYNSTNVETLVEHEDRVIEHYVNTLKKNGCNVLDVSNASKYLGLAVWYEFKNMCAFVKFIKNATKDVSAVGVSYDGLKQLMLKRVVATIHGLYKHCYQREKSL